MTEVSEAILRSPKLRRFYGVTMSTPADPAREHLRKLKGAPYYMSNRRIAELAGVADSTVCQTLRGVRHAARDRRDVAEVRRSTASAILAVAPEINPPARGGGHVNPVGARRRLQALNAAGYPLSFLSAEMGWAKDPAPAGRFVKGLQGGQFIIHSTFRKACEVFDRLEMVRPEDMGIPFMSTERARRSAVRNNYAPAHCWDPDTIDDPDAFPEWTGRCGTAHGRRIHAREGIPVCEACRDADLNPAEGFQAATFRAMRLERGWSQPQLGERIGCARESIAGWENGRCSPREPVVPAILEAFGVERGALFKEE